MKPDPAPVLSALAALNVRLSQAVLVGDSPTDVEAAHRAGVRAIGYANRPSKAAALHEAGADEVIDSMKLLIS